MQIQAVGAEFIRVVRWMDGLVGTSCELCKVFKTYMNTSQAYGGSLGKCGSVTCSN